MTLLNLLPADVRQRLEQTRRLSRWQSSLWWLAANCIVLGVVVFFVSTWLGIHQETLRTQNISTSTAGDKRAQSITAQTQRLNSTIQMLTATIGSEHDWSASAQAVLQLLPADVTVSKLTVTSLGQVTLTGEAKTRQAFLQLQSILTSTTALKNVTTTSTASKPTNVPFAYSARLP